MSLVINVIGIFGSVCIALSLFPQTCKTIQSATMNEISIPFICVTMVGAGSQLSYGIYYNVIPMIIANVCVLFNTIILISYKSYLLIYKGRLVQLEVPKDSFFNKDSTLKSAGVTVDNNTNPTEV